MVRKKAQRRRGIRIRDFSIGTFLLVSVLYFHINWNLSIALGWTTIFDLIETIFYSVGMGGFAALLCLFIDWELERKDNKLSQKASNTQGKQSGDAA